MTYTIDRTQDEFGVDRFNVADEDGDWVEAPFDTYEQAAEEIKRLNEAPCPSCEKPTGKRKPGEACTNCGHVEVEAHHGD